jgi:hypothetical protein
MIDARRLASASLTLDFWNVNAIRPNTMDDASGIRMVHVDTIKHGMQSQNNMIV